MPGVGAGPSPPGTYLICDARAQHSMTIGKGVDGLGTIPYYADESVTLWHGDALTVLTSMPDTSINCCVTSPPYFGLRDYGVEGQLGLEASPAEYVENQRALFAQVRRVLADDGTLWLNLGDSYASGTRTTYADAGKARGRIGVGRTPSILPGKNLLGIPWRVAFALQDDGWILRNDIIWAKPNGMPESVTDRLATKHEHLFMFAKRARYWFDLNAIREPHTESSLARFASGTVAIERRTPGDDREANIYGHGPHPRRNDGLTWDERKAAGVGHSNNRGYNTGSTSGNSAFATNENGKNPGDVWRIATQPFSAAHFAVMPQEIARRAIQAGCRPGGTVLDPFSGSGTTGLAAARHGRKYVGIDLNAEYLDLSLRTRLAQPGLDFGEGT